MEDGTFFILKYVDSGSHIEYRVFHDFDEPVRWLREASGVQPVKIYKVKTVEALSVRR